MRGTLLLLVPLLAAGNCTGPAALPDRTTSSAQASTTTTTGPPPATTTSAPSTTTTTEPLPELQGLAMEEVTDEVHQPVFLTAPPGETRLVVAERTGRLLSLDPEAGLLEEPFLDLRHLVRSVGIEQGLLGLAFHPGYAESGRFFVYFTDAADDTRLVEFRAPEGRADPQSARVLLVIPQPAIRHNGGMLQFGPDGYLYMGVGDGASGGREAQDPGTLLGAILRIDVDGGDPYAIPPDNPFAAGGGAPEIWALGLRNPWRFWIDHPERLLYIGDVGQEDREEIDVVSLEAPGANFGWPVMEGTACFAVRNCDREAYLPPVLDYTHAEGCSVTGGVVYRGAAIPELEGHYLYSDWCGGWLRSFRYQEGRVTDARDWSDQLGAIGQVNSFGVDAQGEVHLLTWDGRVLRLVPVR